MHNFSPTHIISCDGLYVVMLDGGAAYTAPEWDASAAPEFEFDGAQWLYQGQPFAGAVVPYSFAALISAARITARVTQIDQRPDGMGMPWGARHWRVCLRRATGNTRRYFTIYFSQGPAHKQPPTAADVLSCLFMDRVGADMGFAEWAADYGYEVDSRADYALWQQCTAQTRRFDRWTDGMDIDVYTALEAAALEH